MLRLDSTVRKLQAVLSGAVTTNQLPIAVSYSDSTSTSYTGGTTVINTNGTTAVDICAAPSASTVRDIDTINVQNADTVAATIALRYNDNGTLYTLFKATLSVGDQITYVHGQGWKVVDSNGALKSSSSSLDAAILQNSTLITLTSVGGTGNIITAGVPDPYIALADGQEFSFIAAAANTGAVTIALDGGAATDIKKSGGLALELGDIPSGGFVKIKYVSSTGDFEMMGGAGGGGGAKADGCIYENSLTVSNDYTLTTSKNGFSVGPITIDTGVAVTIPSGQRWVIL